MYVLWSLMHNMLRKQTTSYQSSLVKTLNLLLKCFRLSNWQSRRNSICPWWRGTAFDPCDNNLHHYHDY